MKSVIKTNRRRYSKKHWYNFGVKELRKLTESYSGKVFIKEDIINVIFSDYSIDSK
jgi:hypothetical protein